MTVVDEPGHWGIVHHEAVYDDRNEYISVCNDCGVEFHQGDDADAHIRATGHSYRTSVIPHHDLVSAAYDAEEWIPEKTHAVTYAMFVDETYCTVCGEVIETSEPYHY